MKKKPQLSLVAILLQFFFAFHVPVHAAELDTSNTITLKAPNLTLHDFFKEVQKQTGYNYIFNIDQSGPKKIFSVDVENTELEQVLEEVLTPLSLTYSSENNIIVVHQKGKKSVPVQQRKKITIKGRVTDSNKLPLVGVNIYIKGSLVGTTTDSEGNYTMNLIDDPKNVLVFSFVGMYTQEILLKDKITINVVMQEAENALSDVVVNGIFERKTGTFTGSATSYTRKEILATGVQSVFESLKNLEPSLNILENNLNGSNPNTIPDMNIRGISSFPDVRNQYIANPNLPLFILDGFETQVQKVIDLDINRIESITILKDAVAKAIYGSKAANGVIVIETIKVKPGELRMNYSGTLSVETPDLTSYNLCNAAEKLELERTLGLYNGAQPAVDIAYKDLYYNNLAEVKRGVNTDWIAQPLEVGFGNKHFLNIEAGDENLRVGLDLGYNNINGVMKGSGRTTTSGGIDVIYRNGKLTFRNRLTVTNTDSEDSPYGDFSQYAALNPYWRIYEDNGSLRNLLGYGPVFSSPVYNPMIDATIGTRYSRGYFDITNNTYLEYQMNQSFKFVGRFSFTNQTSNSESFLPSSHSQFKNILPGNDNFFLRGSFDAGYGKYSVIGGDFNINYNKVWGKNSLFANIGLNIREDNSENYYYSAVGFPNSSMDNIIFSKQYTLNSKPTGNEALNREVGVLSAINYSYDNRYLVDASFRESASSQFGANNRWGAFWSGGLGWNIHNESFLKNNKVIKQLKIRTSMGYTGSQAFNTSQALLLYNYYVDRSYQGLMGTYLESLANEDLKWQEKYDQNIGLDLNLYNKFNIRLDRYNSTTTNLLTDINVPPSLGFETFRANLGEINNKGYEFYASYRIFSNPVDRISVTVFANGINNKNEIQDISNALQAINSKQDEASETDNRPLVRFEEGQSMTAIWAVKSKGIDPATGKEIFVKKDGSLTDTWDVEDKVVCGDSEAKLRGIMGCNFEYKGFSLNVSLRYRLGGQIYNQTLVSKVENAQMNGNVDKRAFYQSWQQEGDNVLFRNIGDWMNPTLATSRFVQDINTLDISSINLGYDFYRFDFVRKLRLQRFQMMVHLNDVANFSTVRIERGTVYPFARTNSCSLILNF